MSVALRKFCWVNEVGLVERVFESVGVKDWRDETLDTLFACGVCFEAFLFSAEITAAN